MFPTLHPATLKEELPPHYNCVRLHCCVSGNILHNAIPKEESPPHYTGVRLHNCTCGNTLQHAIPKEESLPHQNCVRLHRRVCGNILHNAIPKQESPPHYSCVGLASCGSVIRKLTCHNQELQRSELNKCLIKTNREIELSGPGAAEAPNQWFS